MKVYLEVLSPRETRDNIFANLINLTMREREREKSVTRAHTKQDLPQKKGSIHQIETKRGERTG